MKVYILGAFADDNEKRFLRAEEFLTDQGYEAVNPTKRPNGPYENHMVMAKEHFKALLECDAIYIMPDKENSGGTYFEYYIASLSGMTIIYGNEL